MERVCWIARLAFTRSCLPFLELHYSYAELTSEHQKYRDWLDSHGLGNGLIICGSLSRYLQAWCTPSIL